jgi:hypothetical protein
MDVADAASIRSAESNPLIPILTRGSASCFFTAKAREI